MAENDHQIVTFQYKEEGTADNFNKLLYNVIPNGIIKWGDNEGLLVKTGNNDEVLINCNNTLSMIMSYVDNTTEPSIRITAHVLEKGNNNDIQNVTGIIVSGVSETNSYIIGELDWSNTGNEHYVEYKAVSYSEISSSVFKNNLIIFGKCEFKNQELIDFDYTKTTWSSSYWNNDFMYSNANLGNNVDSPSFLVLYDDNDDNNFNIKVGAGKAIIDGKVLKLDDVQDVQLDTSNSNSELYIDTNIPNDRKDLLIIKYKKLYHTVNDSTTYYDAIGFEYIMGESGSNVPPICPSYGLPLAIFSYKAEDYITDDPNDEDGIIDKIRGSNIEYIYNNNYINSAPTIEQMILHNNVVENVLVI